MFQQQQINFNQTPDFNRVVHTHERAETQEHLKVNYEKFSKQAKLIYDLMMKGERLTMAYCFTHHGIASTSARISELKKNGVEIEKEWELDEDGNKTKK